MEFSRIEGFKTKVDQHLLDTAKELEPQLIYTEHHPAARVDIADEGPFGSAVKLNFSPDQSKALQKGDKIVLDFGKHVTGRISFDLDLHGSPADAPAMLKIRAAEVPLELLKASSEYQGGLSSSWIQEEIIHVDEVPGPVMLDRRYALRYLEIEILETSPKYQISIKNVKVKGESSADRSRVAEIELEDEQLKRMDQASLETMHECMQSVFEDGPKRDRRLWLGDLRLQAQTNYLTFQNLDLVKRCLYLFGALRHPDDHVAANLFISPKYQADDTLLFDYALFFISTLYDYYQASGDLQTLKDLYPVAKKQAELALERLDENGLLTDDEQWWCFLDWGFGLNKQAGAQAVLIYALKQLVELARIMEDDWQHQGQKWISLTSKAALDRLWDKESGFFISGKNRQISWASQIWMVLAGVLSKEENRKLLHDLLEKQPENKPVTPYMMHHLVEALFESGLEEKAVDILKAYWGEMLNDGADTYFEIYDPSDKKASPYGDRIIHSYCHAWSATPSYFIRKYLVQSDLTEK